MPLWSHMHIKLIWGSIPPGPKQFLRCSISSFLSRWDRQPLLMRHRLVLFKAEHVYNLWQT